MFAKILVPTDGSALSKPLRAGHGTFLQKMQKTATDTSVTSVYDRYNYDKEKREALMKWAEMLLAATWPAGKGYEEDTGEPYTVWDFSREWDRMKF